VFKGIEMIDDKAFIRDKYCLGCGRCESVCPSGAISITLDDKTSRVKEIIEKIESHVEVS
jgi:ferredoxin